MIISNAIVVAELQYWFNRFLFTSKLNKNQIPYPSDLEENYFRNDQTFIRLLFDDDWPNTFTFYNYLFSEYSLSSTDFKEIINRLCIYPNPKVFKSTSNSTINFFNLKNQDFIMLDKLIDYRIGNEVVIDSTAEYDTELATLVHIYLDLVINQNINDSFNNSILINNDLLTCLYEIYVTEKMFKFISDLGS